MFSKEYTFRYSDIDSSGEIKTSTIVDLLQDVSICHSADVGYDLLKMQEINIAMLLYGWHIKFLKDVDPKEPVICKTCITKVNRMEVHRSYVILQDQEIIAEGSAIWFAYNFKAGRIVRVPDEINNAYDSINEDGNGIEVSRFRANPMAEPVAQFDVTSRDLDTNNHMNNVKSLEAALSFVCCPENIKSLKVIYQKQILKDEKIDVCMCTDEGELVVELRNQEGESCVLIHLEQN